MRPGLLGPIRSSDEAEAPELRDDVIHDLHLERLWDAMAGDDRILRNSARQVIMHPVDDPQGIEDRQRALSDCLRHRDVVDQLYRIAEDALALRRETIWLPFHGHPSAELSSAVRRLTGFTDQFDRLRALCPQIDEEFSSSAFRDFSERISRELDEGYVAELREMLRELTLAKGLLVSVGVGQAGGAVQLVAHHTDLLRRRFFERLPLLRPRYTFVLPERDQAGADALAELHDRALEEIARIASRAVDQVNAFFAELRHELAFYVGCVRLVDALHKIGAPICFPAADTEDSAAALGIYDPCLALQTGTAPVLNDLELRGSGLLVITGANEGGKSTMLRALGIAQLMMQAGMVVAGQQFAARPVGRVLTHWAREEDTDLSHGKLDEELARMALIVASLRPGDLLLCNESFASTDEAEGSELLLEVTKALVIGGVQVRTVTHLYDFASSVLADASLQARFLRAQRAEADGEDSQRFRLEEGPPLRTSFGVDLYDQTFGTTFGADLSDEDLDFVDTPSAHTSDTEKEDR